MDRSPDRTPLEPYMKEGLRLLRSKDPNAINIMFERFNAAIKEHYGDRKPRNVFEKGYMPPLPWSYKQLQTTANADESSGSSSSSVQESIASTSAQEPIASTSAQEPIASTSAQEPIASTSAQVPIASTSVAETCSYMPPMITMEQAQSDPVIAIQSDSEGETNNDGECCVCKGNILIEVNNLLECYGCHEVYHQTCHTPPITGIIFDDPRTVWNCYKCQPPASQKDDSSVKKIKEKSEVKVHQPGHKVFISAKEVGDGSKPSSANSSCIHYSASSSAMYTGTKVAESSGSLSADQPSDNSPKNKKMHSNILDVEKRVKLMRKNAAAKKPEKPKQYINHRKTY